MSKAGDLVSAAAALMASGRVAEAIAAARAAVARAPGDADAHRALGLALAGKGAEVEALPHLERAARLSPRRGDLWHTFGALSARLGRTAQAVEALERAMKLGPRSHSPPLALGVLNLMLDDPARAEPYLEKAVGLSPPGELESAHQYTRALRMQGKIAESVAFDRGVLRANPDSPDAIFNLAVVLSYAEGGDPAEVRTLLERRAGLIAGAIGPPPPLTNRPDPERRLRIAYLCQDIRRDSAIARFIAAPVLHHDRERFEVLGYCTQPTIGKMTDRLRGAVGGGWVDVSRLDDGALFRRVRADGVDILIETAGTTPGGRLPALVPRAAPVQVSCIGDPRTTGFPCVDARLVDEITDPPGAESLCTERLARLPGCFLCYEPHEESPPARGPIGAGAAGITFGSFHAMEKVGPGVIGTWCRLLEAAPGSRLLLKAGGFARPGVTERFMAKFRAGGIDPARVTIEGPVREMGEHLRQYHRVDIGLDTFPYAGTTTSCDALWMGIPFVTLRGSWHGARVGASLLGEVGLGDLVAGTPEEYVRIAAALAGDRARLAETHRTLRARMATSALGDAPAYARKVEAAYRELWRAWCAAR